MRTIEQRLKDEQSKTKTLQAQIDERDRLIKDSETENANLTDLLRVEKEGRATADTKLLEATVKLAASSQELETAKTALEKAEKLGEAKAARVIALAGHPAPVVEAPADTNATDRVKAVSANPLRSWIQSCIDAHKKIETGVLSTIRKAAV
jgi:chromosome segregation ATPase